MLVPHADGRRTLYYHLAQNGALVTVGQAVSAGQQIAALGCSGQCYGAHLHFEMRAVVGGYWTSVDPIFEKRFTTTPGRVPFLATYLRESNSGSEVIKRYSMVTHWVEFVNAGGRTWRNNVGIGRVFLAPGIPRREPASSARSTGRRAGLRPTSIRPPFRRVAWGASPSASMP